MKTIKKIITCNVLVLLVSLPNAKAQSSPECIAKSLGEWKVCKSQLESKTIKNVLLESDILCTEADNCDLKVHNTSNVKIWSNKGATIKRTGNFKEALISIVNSDTVEIKNIKFEEAPNIPIQLTPKAQEVNQVCVTNKCASTLSVYQSSNITIDKVSVNHGKVFGILLAKTRNVKVSNSIIQNSWWFGIWGSENNNITYYRNQFLNNRSNGILTSTSLTEETKVIENLFSGNHHASAFHTCGAGANEPCPGGQIDLVDPVKNVLIEGNIFENGKMSLEFPEDSKINWISGIEFEAAKSGIVSVYIRNNIVRNNSGSPFYINLPAPEIKDTFSVDLEVSGNTFCNNRTKDYHDPKVTWGGGIRLFNNSFTCAAPVPAPAPKPLRGSISASTCTVTTASANCEATITWSAPDHDKACVFAGNTLWACEGKGKTKTLGFSSLKAMDLILRTGNTANSEEIARTKLQAQLISNPVPVPLPAPIPKIVNKGLGCSDSNCIYLIGPNLKKGMSIDLRDSKTSAMIKGNIQTNYVKNSETEHVLTFVIPPEAREIFKTNGFNLHVVDPVHGTWSQPLFYKRP